ncbi:MAG: type II secretion system GspH family protein [Candidatus Omnitrophica bacterium]|nr:type II secretion system GspH family protein [Candidatus Omnitrophota bacterium]
MRNGFTLIETVISILIIGIAFLGLVAVLTGVFTHATRDEVMSVTTMLAKGEMERVTGEGWAFLEGSGSYSGNFSNYSWQVIMSAVPVAIENDPYMANYKQAEVVVSNAMIGSVSLKTILTNN